MGRGKTDQVKIVNPTQGHEPLGWGGLPETGIHPDKGCTKSNLNDESVVFRSNKLAATEHPQEFGALDHLAQDDELVYVPDLNLSQVPGCRALTFEILVQYVYAKCLVDSGATHSFVSLDFADAHNFVYEPVSQPLTRLADGSCVRIHGVLRNVHFKLGTFRSKQSFLVVDMPGLDVVLGMDFLSHNDVTTSFRKRTMSITWTNARGCHAVTLNAFHEPSRSTIDVKSDLVELCSLDAFAKEARRVSKDELDDAFVACVMPELDSVDVAASDLDDPVLSGRGAMHPYIRAILNDFRDVLVTEIPGGLPPERLDADGNSIEHTIETDPNVLPFKVNPKPFTAEEDAELQRYLRELLSIGWIVPSLSPWAAPVLFVPKKVDPATGKRTWRMCISYVKLNSKTLNRIAYRLPLISELLERISGATVFTKLDLLSGYYQVRMRAQDVPKTAFTTPYGNFEFRVMPMGLCGAPSTFQYMMDNTFRRDFIFPDGSVVPYQHFLAVYLDDICIFSTSEEEHLMHVRAVMQRLRDHSLYVKPTKCEWMQTSIEFLGHIASADGLSVHPDKAAALQSWPVPRDVHDLRSLLGTFGFWRPYIPQFAMITAPLSQLLKKGVVWRWRGDVEQIALDTLKCAVKSAPILMHPDMSKPFVVVSDASDFGVGASLEQVADDDGRRRPVAFFSHKLNRAECGYPVHERE